MDTPDGLEQGIVVLRRFKQDDARTIRVEIQSECTAVVRGEENASGRDRLGETLDGLSSRLGSHPSVDHNKVDAEGIQEHLHEPADKGPVGVDQESGWLGAS